LRHREHRGNTDDLLCDLCASNDRREWVVKKFS
jgi:hypothetical protein